MKTSKQKLSLSLAFHCNTNSSEKRGIGGVHMQRENHAPSPFGTFNVTPLYVIHLLTRSRVSTRSDGLGIPPAQL